ncbi:MAG: hypothetical protein M5R36_05120 [Deltaproteobacteria bacterium]|nr:hypothetical protein [Deltaproteobacteria bacterium]
MGFLIVQIPVTWRDSADTRVRLGTDVFVSLRELLDVRVNHLLGRYIFAKSYQGEEIAP